MIKAVYTKILRQAKAHKVITFLVIVFVLSRVIIYHFLPFDVREPIKYDLHLLDPDILKNHLLYGVYYMHGQPPLWNIFVGVLLKLDPYIRMEITYPFIYFILGLFISLGSYFLQKLLGAAERLAALGALCVMFFPTLVQSERWLYYAYPLAAMLLASTFLIYFFVKTGKLKYFFLFFLIQATMVLTRGFFHLLFWVVPLMTIATIYIAKAKLPRPGKYWAIMVLFLALASFPYVKNYLMFGVFASSTTQGMNITGSIHYVRRPEIQDLVNKKVVTPLALVPRLLPPIEYYNYYGIKPSGNNLVLDTLLKPSYPQYFNFNNRIYVRASKEYQSNSIKIILHYPLRYLMSVANETYIFLGFFQYREFDNFRNWGSVRVHNLRDKILFDITAYPLPLVMLCLYGIACYMLAKQWKKGKNFQGLALEQRANYALVLFLSFTIAYTYFFSVAIDAGEANILRIPIDPFLVCLVVLSLGNIFIPKFKILKFFREEGG